jgi:ATP-dependent DNA helicase RecG
MCFGRSYLKSVFLPGKKFFITGSFGYRNGEIQSSHFEYEEYDPNEQIRRPDAILPVYRLSEGLTQKKMRRIIRAALESTKNRMAEELPESIRSKRELMPFESSIRQIHYPKNQRIMEQARRTLTYHELFFLLMTLFRRRLQIQSREKQKRKKSFRKKNLFLRRLPFELTGDQTRALEEIEADLFAQHPMSRLLQGDVGCGKTLVALLASLAVIEAGEQVALMVPTELLANQHAEYTARLFEPLGVRTALLTGHVTGEKRSLLIAALSRGEVQMVIGTQALFSREVSFHRLGLVIVDEQHRFGVRQRIALMDKGRTAGSRDSGGGASPGWAVDLLLMTATPIPRSLALTVFGDLDVSTIRHLPPGRKPVVTHLTREGNEQKVYERVRQELKKGRQAYFVYPRIENETEPGTAGTKSAEEMFRTLQAREFPGIPMELIHSRVEESEKQRHMEAFTQGRLGILVATSVVEVGVDVSNATCMVIEGAERFGLTTLHQLRGRVGRGPLPSYCFLIYSRDLTENGIERLKTIMSTSDGFRIAEEDLRIRGPGELLGVRQAGYPKLRIAALHRDRDILEAAHLDAQTCLRRDPDLSMIEHRCIGEVLTRVPPFGRGASEGG